MSFRLRQFPLAGIFRQHFPGENLRGFDIGLVEGLDAHPPAGDRGSHLPAEKLAAEVVHVAAGDFNDRMAGRDAISDERILAAIVRQAQTGKKTCPRQPRPEAEASPTTGRMPLPDFPVLSAISCSSQSANDAKRSEVMKVILFLPESARWPMIRPRRTASLYARRGIVDRVAAAGHRGGADQEFPDVDAQQRRRDDAEERQRGIAAADIRIVQEDFPKLNSLAAVSSPLPGSVMAMKCLPAFSLPTLARV